MASVDREAQLQSLNFGRIVTTYEDEYAVAYACSILSRATVLVMLGVALYRVTSLPTPGILGRDGQRRRYRRPE